MNPTEHPFTPELLMAFVDREAAGPEEARVAAHLESCAECRALEAQLRRDSRELRRWTVPQLSGDAASRIAARLARQAVPRRRRAWLVSRRFAWQAAGALGVLTVSILLLMRPLQRSTSLASLPAGDLRQTQYAIEPRITSAYGLDAKGHSLDLAQTDQADYAVSVKSTPPVAPMIAHTAEIALVVKDLNAARTGMEQLLARHHGYASELAVSGERGGSRSLEASLKVPSAELPSLLVDLKTLGRVTKEAQKGEEVTTAYVDLTARLANAKETEKRLVEILRTRTGKVSEVLEVEEQISTTREEIERMEAERKGMETRVSFSTVALSLFEEYKAQLQPSVLPVGTRLHNAFVQGMENALDSGVGALAWVASLLPSLVLWGAVSFFPLRWGWRRWQATVGRAV